jgi:hypothetical protein
LSIPARQLDKGPGRGHAQQPAELAVAGHAALAVAQDVDGAEVAGLAVGGGERAQEGGVVVVGDGAWVVDAEGVEGVGEGEEGVFERVGWFLYGLVWVG